MKNIIALLITVLFIGQASSSEELKYEAYYYELGTVAIKSLYEKNDEFNQSVESFFSKTDKDTLILVIESIERDFALMDNIDRSYIYEDTREQAVKVLFSKYSSPVGEYCTGENRFNDCYQFVEPGLRPINSVYAIEEVLNLIVERIEISILNSTITTNLVDSMPSSFHDELKEINKRVVIHKNKFNSTELLKAKGYVIDASNKNLWTKTSVLVSQDEHSQKLYAAFLVLKEKDFLFVDSNHDHCTMNSGDKQVEVKTPYFGKYVEIKCEIKLLIGGVGAPVLYNALEEAGYLYDERSKIFLKE